MTHEEIKKHLKDNHTHEEVIGMFVNLAKKAYGNDVVIKPAGSEGCCPPNTCGVCVGGACIGC